MHEQIERDVMRTHPDMHFFSGSDGAAVTHRKVRESCLSHHRACSLMHHGLWMWSHALRSRPKFDMAQSRAAGDLWSKRKNACLAHLIVIEANPHINWHSRGL